MSKSIFAKVAAVACSVASLGMLGIAASAEQKNTEIADRKDLVAGKTNIVAGIVEAEPGDTVKFPVYVTNNTTGFAATGVRLIHDARLTVPLNANKKPITKKGDAGDAVTTTFSYNADKRIIGLGTMGTDPEMDNGVMYEVDIQVPADAKPGDSFPMTIEIDKWLDASTNPIEHEAVPGKIFIAGGSSETTTTSTTSDTTTTTSTTPTTISTAPTTISTAPTTISTAPTTISTSSTVSTQSTSSTVSTTTTTGTNKGTPVVTTTAKGGSTSSTTATKTGDAGVGVAVAGLLLAAGTAVVATKKKKD